MTDALTRLADAGKFTTKHWVYVIGCFEHMDRVKIGIASDVTSRIKSLQCGSAFSLHLWGSFPAGHKREQAVDLEMRIHSILSTKRIHSEWFKISPKDALHIVASFNVNPPAKILADWHDRQKNLKPSKKN